MKKIKRIALRAMYFIPNSVGVYNFLRSMLRYPLFIADYFKFKRLQRSARMRFSARLENLFPNLLDKTDTTPFDPHYTYHPAWAARIVAKINPKKHIDIASTLHFCSIVSAFVPVEFYDYRPAQLNLPNLESKRGDLLALPFPDNSVESLSCMHTIEHVGLGRYGDRMDPEGDLKAINELKRVLSPEGSLLFVVPIGGKAIIEFNAHRIYTYEQIMSYFSDLDLKEFSLIHEHERDGGITLDATKELADKERYGCGCFWFIKPKNNDRR